MSRGASTGSWKTHCRPCTEAAATATPTAWLICCETLAKLVARLMRACDDVGVADGVERGEFEAAEEAADQQAEEDQRMRRTARR